LNEYSKDGKRCKCCRLKTIPRNVYFSQQAQPLSGCAQQAPAFSSGVKLGLQHFVFPAEGVQQEDSAAGVDWLGLLFCNTRMSESCFSMRLSFECLHQ
jgi:hypothetical protein